MVFATHNRAGYILFSPVPNTQCLTYHFTIVTFTKTSSPADRPTLTVNWGDNVNDTTAVTRTYKNAVGTNYPDVSINVYDYNNGDNTATHTFPGPGTYVISVLDPNRDDGVLNMTNSVNQPFFIETTLIISPYFGCDNSPIVLNPPIDQGCVGVPFIYTPNAYDLDGDSISYVLVPCRGANGQTCLGYSYPVGSTSFSLDPVTGTVSWISPMAAGQYNVAMLIVEWRKIGNVMMDIGHVTLDMQIIINNCNISPPAVDALPDTCLLAGGTVHYSVTGHAPSSGNVYSNAVYLFASGGPLTFDAGNCSFTTPTDSGILTLTGTFHWLTECHDIRKQPYQISFIAQRMDIIALNGPPWADTMAMVAMENVNITVVAPAPQNPTALPVGNNIDVTWNESPCPQAIGYKVYRKNGLFNGVIQCPCQTGVPSSTGFVLVATISGLTDTSFIDSNNGLGLTHGIDYCYMITAIFADGSESCASPQACAELKKDSPIITNVSVDTTDATAGAMYIAWSAPSELDTHQYRGPYVYKIYRSNDFTGNNMHLIDATPSSVNLNDTIYYDDLAVNRPFNTLDNPWSYRIDLYSNDTLVDKSSIASSVYLSLTPTNHTINLSWHEDVQWTDTGFVVYRLNHFTGNWDSITYTTGNTYSNTGLANDTSYCYYVKSAGYYSTTGFVYPIINYSEQKCIAAKDNVFPCAPNLTINANCIAHVDSLIWNNPNYTCASGVIEYKVYIDTNYTADTSTFKLLATITNLSDTTFIYNNSYSIAGCFKVTALDTVLNESQIANTVCVDNCPDYTLPNVFTPNGDGSNDFFHPFPYSFVKDIDIEIFDRWGIKMFKTTNPDINWDGTNSATKGICPDGVYFYICKVHEIHYNGIKTVTLKGNIELIREKK